MFDKFQIFFLKLEQKINSTDANSRQNCVFCQDAKQNRQIITVRPITCPQQNTETFNKRHCIIEQRQNNALSMPVRHTQMRFLFIIFTALLKSSSF